MEKASLVIVRKVVIEHERKILLPHSFPVVQTIQWVTRSVTAPAKEIFHGRSAVFVHVQMRALEHVVGRA